jgi:hypothetical protein
MDLDSHSLNRHCEALTRSTQGSPDRAHHDLCRVSQRRRVQGSPAAAAGGQLHQAAARPPACLLRGRDGAARLGPARGDGCARGSGSATGFERRPGRAAEAAGAPAGPSQGTAGRRRSDSICASATHRCAARPAAVGRRRQGAGTHLAEQPARCAAGQSARRARR